MGNITCYTGLNEVPPHAEPSTELNKGQLYL